MSFRTSLERRMTRRRRLGLNVSPVRAPHIRGRGKAFKVTTRYGVPGTRWAAGHHTGEDYACPTGSHAVAVTWGRVVYVGQYGGWSNKGLYGLHVIVRTPSYDYAYCHLSRSLLSVGDKVRPGRLVGLTGATGNVTGPHLHFEVRPSGGLYGSDVHPRAVRRTRRVVGR